MYYNSNDLINYIKLIEKYFHLNISIFSIDYQSWIKFNSLMKDKIMIVGDDLYI